jgi:hypothetical protein
MNLLGSDDLGLHNSSQLQHYTLLIADFDLYALFDRTFQDNALDGACQRVQALGVSGLHIRQHTVFFCRSDNRPLARKSKK